MRLPDSLSTTVRRIYSVYDLLQKKKKSDKGNSIKHYLIHYLTTVPEILYFLP